MKAIVYAKYGPPDVLELKDIEKPTPKDDEVLVKVHAVSLNAYDWHFLRADPFIIRLMGGGLLRPKNPILGADIAGRIEMVGGAVTGLKPGDEVFGDVASTGGGGLAEYVCTRESTLAPKPANLSFEEAAAVPMAAITALQGLRDKGRIAPGSRVLINGASGGVGTFAVQIAKSFGADVTAVCRTDKMDLARALGADHVIDYTLEDFTRNGAQYDLIFAANGYHPLLNYRRSLAPKGVYMAAGGSMAQVFQALLIGPWFSRPGGKKMGAVMARASRKDLLAVKELLEAGKVVPVIDRRYPLSEAPEAFRYLGKGHARGKIVISVRESDER